MAVGRALTRALGWREVTWLEPAVGFAVLALVGSLTIRAFNGAGGSAIALGLSVAASLAYLRGRMLPRREVGAAAGAALAATALASLPFIASERLGVLGVGINNDLATHELWAEWLRTQSDPAPVGLINGYPIGLHSLAASLGQVFGFEMTDAFAGLLIAVAVLTALTAVGPLRDLPAVRRTFACALVALPYMGASAFAIGGFKETAMALIVLAFVVALARLEREWPGDRALAVSLGVLAAGSLSVYSYPGLYWLAGAAALLALAGAARALRRRHLGLAFRRAAPLVAVGAAVLLVAGASEIDRAVSFQERSGIEQTISGNSKLRQAVSPLETLGAWPHGNYLAGTSGPPAWALFAAIGLLALAYATLWWLRRGSLAIPLGVAAAGAIYLGALARAGFYVQAKALAVPAALVMLMLVASLLTPGREAEVGRRRQPAPGSARWARYALAAAFAVVAASSTFVALRDAIVAPNTHANELNAIRARVGDGWVLSLTTDRFTDYELRSTKVASPFLNAEIIVPSTRGKDYVLPLDFDSAPPEVYDLFKWVLVTRAPYRSAPPPNLRLVAQTRSYELWKRVGPTPLDSRVLGEKGKAGKLLRCRSEAADGRRALAVGTSATIFRQPPMVAQPTTWRPGNQLSPGTSATRTVDLPRGRWLLSLQYLSPLRGVTVRAAGHSFELPASVDGAVPFRYGPWWRVGEIRSPGGPVKVTVQVHRVSALQRLLGVDRPAVIGKLAATRPDPEETVPISAACGHYVDHYFVSSSMVRSQSAAVQRRRQRARVARAGHFRPTARLEAESNAANSLRQSRTGLQRAGTTVTTR